METLKRSYEEVDPDYQDACEQQTKRQRELEQDAKQTVIRRVQGIIRNEFRKEINNKEMELHQVDRRLNEARLMMDRLRACIVSTYYGQINQFGTSEMSKMNGPPSSIHPAVKKHLGKTPSQYDKKPDVSTSQMQSSSRAELSLNEVSDSDNSFHQRNESGEEQLNRTSDMASAYKSSATGSGINVPHTGIPGVTSAEAAYDDRRARFKIKKKIIIGNVSKYIPLDHREANDKSSHKWMVYVRGPKSEPDISGYVKKVWFFLHHSYKPNDLVEISSPPFHLTRRGWGEFPVRVQLHFVDPRNKKVDIIHQLKLDKTFSGLQTLGAETVVELDLEKDFFESDTNSNKNYKKPVPSCSFSSSSTSFHHQQKISSSSVLKAAISTSDKQQVSSQNGRILSSEHSENVRSIKCEADYSDLDITSENHNVAIKMETSDSCKADACDGVSEIEELADDLESNVKSLEEYHMTIVHDTDDSEHSSRRKENLVNRSEAVNDKLEILTDNSNANLPVIPDPHDCSSASERKVRELPSVTPSTKTTLTIINKPQWVNTESSYTSNKSDPVFITSQIPQQPRSLSATSESVKPLNIVSEPVCSLLVQPSSCIPTVSNGYSVQRSSSPVTNVTQLRPSALSSLSSLPFSVSVLPISQTAPRVTTSGISSGQSKSLLSFSLPQNVSLPPMVGSSILPLSQHQTLRENQSSKVIIVKPKTSLVTPQVVSTSNIGSESKLLLQPKLSGTRQVSLLTGKVFTPPTAANKISLANNGSNETLLTNNCVVTKQIIDQATILGKSSNQITQSIPGAQMLLLKPGNHSSLSLSSSGHLLSKPHSSTNHIKNMNSLVRQGLNSQVINVSIVNPIGQAEKSAVPSSLLNNCISVSNPNIQASQPRQTGIILQVPGQGQHQLINTQNLSILPKMSAIGITKHGRNSAGSPILSTTLKPTTDEERKRNQYEVLMTWKRNRHLQEQGKQVVKTTRDIIEGEADVISELNLDDYTSLRALVKAAVRLHPLVQAGVNKLTHPYCAESLEQWNIWTLGKQLASEWHRACFTLKYLKKLVGKSGCFKGEQLMTTRQLVRWCRLHAFSPFVAVAKAKPIATDDSMHDASGSLQNCDHTPSFTPADSLQVEMMAEVADNVGDNCRQDLDVIDITDIDASSVKKVSSRNTELSDAEITMECLPASDGALFVTDELRKRGIKLQPSELEPGVIACSTADMLYKAMQEFVADILRETVAVSMQQIPHSTPVEVTRQDVHKALTQLPEASFSCNKFLGKADGGSDGNGR